MQREYLAMRHYQTLLARMPDVRIELRIELFTSDLKTREKAAKNWSREGALRTFAFWMGTAHFARSRPEDRRPGVFGEHYAWRLRF